MDEKELEELAKKKEQVWMRALESNGRDYKMAGRAVTNLLVEALTANHQPLPFGVGGDE